MIFPLVVSFLIGGVLGMPDRPDLQSKKGLPIQRQTLHRMQADTNRWQTFTYILSTTEAAPFRATYQGIYRHEEYVYYNLLAFRSVKWQYLDVDRIYLKAGDAFFNKRLHYLRGSAKRINNYAWEKYIFKLRPQEMDRMAFSREVRIKIGEDSYRLPAKARKDLQRLIKLNKTGR